MKLKLQNYNIIRNSGYISLDNINLVYEFEDKWIKSGKLVLVVFCTLVLLSVAALLVLLTANEATPQDTVSLSAIAVLIGGWLSWVAFRYYMYIQEMQGIRNRIIKIDSFLTEVIDNDPTRRARFESCRNIVHLHNAAYQAMHSYLSRHRCGSGSNSYRVALLAKCFALFSMSNDERRSLITQLKAT